MPRLTAILELSLCAALLGGCVEQPATPEPTAPRSSEPAELEPESAAAEPPASATTTVDPPQTVELSSAELLEQLVAGGRAAWEEAGWSATRAIDQRSLRRELRLCVGVDGRVSAVELLDPNPHTHGEVALRGRVRGWRFDPFVIDGAPTVACATLRLRCELVKRSTTCAVVE